ncbi:Uma2 family endonuclease [Microbispora sp. H10670]|uniref:Uma2 family endonuclease n=1 Tax=Microbispora sp. H10670 TaxID=2729108 RepID=UPI0016022B5B|nr:Uma2 family endonuclease [Microbispora sp. H10670]
MALTKPTRRGRRWHVPRSEVSASAEPQPEPIDGQDDIQRLCQELNDAGYRAEITYGRVVVSPMVSREQSNITFRLMNQLFDSVRENRWVIHSNWGVHIPPFPDMRLPDLMIAPQDAEQYDDMHIFGDGALLVVEVCSKGTRSIDWDEKPLEYARAGVPLLLIVDPVTDPATVTLMQEPRKDLAPDDLREPYQRISVVNAGEALRLPAPFDIDLDTGALFA